MRRERISPIGLDVGSRCVKAAQVAVRAGGGPARVIAGACFARLEPDTPVSAREMDRVAGALDRLGFAGRECVASVDRASLITAELELPPTGSGAPREQIARLELARTHRREPAGFEMGLWEVPAPARAGPGAHALAVACPHERAESILDAAHSAGLDVIALDHPGCALARLGAVTGGPTRAILDLGWSAGVLVLARGGAVLYERVIEGGSLSALHAGVVAHTGLDLGVVETLLGDGAWSELAGARRGEKLLDRTVRCVNEYADAVGRELKLSMDYLAHRFPAGAKEGASVGHVDLVGGGAACAGVVERLAQRSGLELRALRPSDVLGADAGVLPIASAPSLSLAVGLALRAGEGDA